ncbi:serine/threonine-protein kinase [Cumulibacter soli]|uniref:serine/threonine-protein kinase n=1 Tax=Cumulibacter soli TaxID=2546344 RepID=UPI0014195729|nr:serine/threonine-protein kinase [Cumulibacter soli]
MSQAPQVLAGRYRLENPIGKGGMGTVWQAHDQLLQRKVAIKQIRSSVGVDRDLETREARLAAQLRHPNAVTIHDLISADGDLWLIMDYIEGPALSSVLRHGPLPPARVARLGAQTASALAAAHALGIVHRDVKPGNLLLSAQDEALLSDFGIARADGDPHVTAEGFITGTPAYLPPEVVRGRPAGPAADAWGLGATLFHAVEGYLPFGDGPTLVLLQRIGNAQREPMRAAGPLAGVIDGLMAADEARRMTALQAVDALDDVLRKLAQQPLGRARMEAAETVRALAPPTRMPPPSTTPRGGDPAPASADAVAAQGAEAPTNPRARTRAQAPRRSPWWLVAIVGVVMLAAGYGLRWVTEPATEAGGSGTESIQDASGDGDSSESPDESLSPAEQAEEVVTQVLVGGAEDPEAAWELIAPELQQTLSGGHDGFISFFEQIESPQLSSLHCGEDLVCSITWDYFTSTGHTSRSTLVYVGDSDGELKLVDSNSAELFVL